MDYETWHSFNSDSIARRLDRLKQKLKQIAAAQDGSELAKEQLSEEVDYDSADLSCEMLDGLEIIENRFGLSTFERECLFLCASLEFDLEIGELCSLITGESKPYPTPGFCMQLFENAAWDLLSPERPLKKSLLVDFAKQSLMPQLRWPMIADPRVCHFIRGLSYLDERLSWYVSPLENEHRDRLSTTQIEVIDAALEANKRAHSSNQKVVFQVTGSSESLRCTYAAHLADRFRMELRHLSVENLPSSVDELDTLARLWNRDVRLSPCGLQIDLEYGCCDTSIPKLVNFVGRLEGFVVVTASDKQVRLGGMEVSVKLPTSSEQKQAWLESASIQTQPNIAEQNSGQFDLELGQIDRIVENLGRELESCDLQAQSWDACRAAVRPNLDQLAQRIDCRATWSDFVVPDEPRSLLKQITNHVRYRSKVLDEWGFRQRLNRGYGVTALFSGESGTGKTMAAEVIANDLRLDLYRIDLSQVVNKYIGETEKNLRKVFDAAECGGAILFFDEADALFGKRSEVKDSHDRYANIETNYLLQRLESFRGLAILASNNKSNMDSAFLRRLRFVVDFTFPEAAERKEIWRRVFPSETPLSAFDATQLAKIGVAGGNIHNIALNAAFSAAATRDSIDMSSLLDSAKSELIKAQKPLSVPGVQWPTTQEARS